MLEAERQRNTKDLGAVFSQCGGQERMFPFFFCFPIPFPLFFVLLPPSINRCQKFVQI